VKAFAAPFSALVAAGVLAACGTPGADLFVIERSGSIPGAKLTLRVTDDGFVYCNGRKREITSDQLIRARDIARRLAKPASHDLALRRGPGSVLSYRVRVEAGTVAFSDSSRPQPAILFTTAAFARELARGACGLPR
jgi:hypothetical protein